MTATQQPVVGVFADREQARRAVDELRRAGFGEDQVGVVVRDGNAGAPPASGAGTDWEEGAVAGATGGAGIGALWALAVAAGVLPALGPVLAGGLLVSVLASAVGGAAVGGVVGALVGLGVPPEEAAYYDSEFRLGRALVTVRAGPRSDDVREILRQHGALERAAAPAGSL